MILERLPLSARRGLREQAFPGWMPRAGRQLLDQVVGELDEPFGIGDRSTFARSSLTAWRRTRAGRRPGWRCGQKQVLAGIGSRRSSSPAPEGAGWPLQYRHPRRSGPSPHSIIGWLVLSRNAFTAAAVISAIIKPPGGSLFWYLDRTGVVDGRLHSPAEASSAHWKGNRGGSSGATAGDSPFRLRHFRVIVVRPFGMDLLHLAGRGPARQNRIGQVMQDQLDRADAVVVAGDRQIDIIRIRVGIDQGHRGDPQFLASRTAFFSFLGSIITRHSGSRFIVRIPFRLRYILRYSRVKADCIFFEYSANSSLDRNASSSSGESADADRTEVGEWDA